MLAGEYGASLALRHFGDQHSQAPTAQTQALPSNDVTP